MVLETLNFYIIYRCLFCYYNNYNIWVNIHFSKNVYIFIFKKSILAVIILMHTNSICLGISYYIVILWG